MLCRNDTRWLTERAAERPRDVHRGRGVRPDIRRLDGVRAPLAPEARALRPAPGGRPRHGRGVGPRGRRACARGGPGRAREARRAGPRGGAVLEGVGARRPTVYRVRGGGIT